ncbi:MAG TPA: DUF4296 domain-containing protein [Ignavibacteriaceae bacterium]|nr:DUF4296 domain-containing protein [Ignavibacteriaceae bacterium]
MKKYFLFVLIFFLFAYCSEKPPVPEKKMIMIYTDMMFAQDTVLVTIENVDSIKADVFKRNNVTESDYIETLEFYNKSPQRWEMFFKRVIEYVESLKTKPDESP